MTLRSLVGVIALLAAPLALADNAAAAFSAQPAGSDTGTTTPAVTTARTTQTPRKIERARPGMMPLKPRVIEAPGAALMMIPASYDPTQNGPFSPL